MSGDLEALLRVTAPNYVGETPPDVAFGTADTPIGTVVVAVTSRGVVTCSFDSEHAIFARVSRDVGSFIGPDPRRLDPVRRELEAYFDGRLRGFTLPVDLRLATPFARTVLQMITAVPYGSTTTHQELADRIGRPMALRAVANAVGANPVCLILPCHRAIVSEGVLGAYPGGAAAKQALLRLEGAPS